MIWLTYLLTCGWNAEESGIPGNYSKGFFKPPLSFKYSYTYVEVSKHK